MILHVIILMMIYTMIYTMIGWIAVKLFLIAKRPSRRPFGRREAEPTAK